MVRGLGVSHKSLFVPSVTEGSYAIRFEHADYLQKEFNISVGAGLPTTFTEGMTEKSYSMEMLYAVPATAILKDATITEGDVITFNTYIIRNNGNISAYPWYGINGAGVSISVLNTTLLLPGDMVNIVIPDQPTTVGIGDHTIIFEVGPSPTTFIVDKLPTSDVHTEVLTISEWATDVTFIATAPGISDLHGVEVFIDGTSMGTT